MSTFEAPPTIDDSDTEELLWAPLSILSMNTDRFRPKADARSCVQKPPFALMRLIVSTLVWSTHHRDYPSRMQGRTGFPRLWHSHSPPAWGP